MNDINRKLFNLTVYRDEVYDKISNNNFMVFHGLFFWEKKIYIYIIILIAISNPHPNKTIQNLS